MFKNYLKISIRSLLRYKVYSLINLLGLAIGIACCLLILLYVQYELSFDRYHENADRIYRTVGDSKVDGVGEEPSSAPFPVGPTLKADFPDAVEASARFFNFQTQTLSIEYEDKRFNEKYFFMVDSTVFDIFTIPFIIGNPQTALDGPNSVVISESIAKKYFGNANPMGKILKFEGQVDLKVTGVIRNTPSNSHFRYDLLASLSTLKVMWGGSLPQNWYWNPCWTYVLLNKNVQPQTLEARFPDFIQKYYSDQIKDKTKLFLQPLIDIHLHSHLDFEIEPNSDISYVYIFSIIAVFILLIACINFMNLATARSANRSREVGMRKVLGAYRFQLIKQFLGESVLLSFIALLLAIIMVEAVLPTFNNLSGRELVINYFENGVLLIGLFVIAITVGIIAGMYPALFVSAFQPVKVLKGSLQSGAKSSTVRKMRVVSQFALSIILIIATGISHQQLNYLRNEKLGFEKEQVLLMPIFRTPVTTQYEAFSNRIVQHPNVASATGIYKIVGSKFDTDSYFPEGIPSGEPIQFPFQMVQHDFIETFNMELIAGRDFSRDMPTDRSDAVIINEATARHMGWSTEEAVGKKFANTGPLANDKVRVIGVVKDFNFASLHHTIQPFVVDLADTNIAQFFTRYVAVKLLPGNLRETLDFLQETWAEFAPSRNFDYFFLDENLNALYKAEENLGRIFTTFSVLAIFVACLGLFALASFTAEQRTKEIGIRKTLGATVSNITLLLSKEFAILVILANLIAWPVAYFAMNRWLQDFAFHTTINLWIFLIAGISALLIAILTVSYQSIKAALTNPVDALKYE